MLVDIFQGVAAYQHVYLYSFFFDRFDRFIFSSSIQHQVQALSEIINSRTPLLFRIVCVASWEKPFTW